MLLTPMIPFNAGDERPVVRGDLAVLELELLRRLEPIIEAAARNMAQVLLCQMSLLHSGTENMPEHTNGGNR